MKRLKNKRVALVGPAGYLQGEHLGSVIDSYDIVVRLGACLPIPELFHVDYGARCDILCDNLWGWIEGQPLWRVNEEQYLEALGPRHLRFVGLKHVGFQRFIRRHQDWSSIHEQRYLHIFSVIQAIPTKGIVSVIDLLDQPLSELYVTGFSFFKEAQGALYAPFYFPHVKHLDFKSDAHKPEREFQHFKNLLKKDQRLKVDPILLALINKD